LLRVTERFLSESPGVARPQGFFLIRKHKAAESQGNGSNLRKNLSSKCYLVVVYLLDIYILKVFLIITKGNRTMKLGWITYKNFKVDLNDVPVRTIEAIIKDLPEGHEGRAKMQALLKDAYRDLERQLQYEIEN